MSRKCSCLVAVFIIIKLHVWIIVVYPYISYCLSLSVFCFFVRLFVCLFVCLFVFLFVCLLVYLFTSSCQVAVYDDSSRTI